MIARARGSMARALRAAAWRAAKKFIRILSIGGDGEMRNFLILTSRLLHFPFTVFRCGTFTQPDRLKRATDTRLFGEQAIG
jgi:hypothetical protein